MDDSKTDRERFAVMMGTLSVLPGKQPDAVAMRAYWATLQEYSIEQVESSGRQALISCKWFPSPVELRQLCGELQDDDRAVRAWDATQYACDRIGPYKQIEFDDVAINAAIRHVGPGWPDFYYRRSDSDKIKWLRHEFTKAYQSYVRAGVDGEAGEALPGLSEVSVMDGTIMPAVTHRIKTGLPPVRKLAIASRERRLPRIELKTP